MEVHQKLPWKQMRWGEWKAQWEENMDGKIVEGGRNAEAALSLLHILPEALSYERELIRSLKEGEKEAGKACYKRAAAEAIDLCVQVGSKREYETFYPAVGRVYRKALQVLFEILLQGFFNPISDNPYFGIECNSLTSSAFGKILNLIQAEYRIGGDLNKEPLRDRIARVLRGFWLKGANPYWHSEPNPHLLSMRREIAEALVTVGLFGFIVEHNVQEAVPTLKRLALTQYRFPERQYGWGKPLPAPPPAERLSQMSPQERNCMLQEHFSNQERGGKEVIMALLGLGLLRGDIPATIIGGTTEKLITSITSIVAP